MFNKLINFFVYLFVNLTLLHLFDEERWLSVTNFQLCFFITLSFPVDVVTSTSQFIEKSFSFEFFIYGHFIAITLSNRRIKV